MKVIRIIVDEDDATKPIGFVSNKGIEGANEEYVLGQTVWLYKGRSIVHGVLDKFYGVGRIAGVEVKTDFGKINFHWGAGGDLEEPNMVIYHDEPKRKKKR